MIFNSQDCDGEFYEFGRAPDNSGALLVCGDERPTLRDLIVSCPIQFNFGFVAP
jgi:hypothetical protein